MANSCVLVLTVMCLSHSILALETTFTVEDSTGVQLVNGEQTGTSLSGRVMLTIGEDTGPICNTFTRLSRFAAVIVCRTLGYTDGIPVGHHVFGKGYDSDETSFDVWCFGWEMSILECSISETSCSPRSDAGVVCTNDTEADINIRLVSEGESTDCGRVELAIAGHNYKLCYNRWQNQYAESEMARVICRTMGKGDLAHPVVPGSVPSSENPPFDTQLMCYGWYYSIFDCYEMFMPMDNFLSTDCNIGHDFGICCFNDSYGIEVSLDVRDNTSVPSSSVAEIIVKETNETGATLHICLDGLSYSSDPSLNGYGHGYGVGSAASTACTNYGYMTGLPKGFPHDTENLWYLYNINCDVWDHSCLTSNYYMYMTTNCTMVAGVYCYNDIYFDDHDIIVQLDGNPDLRSGVVEVTWGGEIGIICQSKRNLTMMESNALCRMAFGSSFISSLPIRGNLHDYDVAERRVWLDYLSCSHGYEETLFECSHGVWGGNFSCKDDSRIAGVMCFNETDVIVRVVPTIEDGEKALLAGRVEITINDETFDFCDNNFVNIQALTLCISFGYSFGYAMRGSYFGEGDWKIYSPSCDMYGDLSSCIVWNNDAAVVGKDHCTSASVVCFNDTYTPDFKVHLVDGKDSVSGRIEVEFLGRNGTIFPFEYFPHMYGYDYYDPAYHPGYYDPAYYGTSNQYHYYSNSWEAMSGIEQGVCSYLNLSRRGIPVAHGEFGQGSGPVLVNGWHVRCNQQIFGYELCPNGAWWDDYGYFGTSFQEHAYDMGVICLPETDISVTLVGGEETADHYYGQLQVNINGYALYPANDHGNGYNDGLWDIGWTICSAKNYSTVTEVRESGLYKVEVEDGFEILSNIQNCMHTYSDGPDMYDPITGMPRVVEANFSSCEFVYSSPIFHEYYHHHNQQNQDYWGSTIYYTKTDFGHHGKRGIGIICTNGTFGNGAEISFADGGDASGKLNVTIPGLMELSVCASSMNVHLSSWLCKQLGFNESSALMFGGPTDRMFDAHVATFGCSGEEWEDLEYCMSNSYLVGSCYYWGGIATLYCNGNGPKAELVNLEYVTIESNTLADTIPSVIGTVEFNVGGHHGRVCDWRWTDEDAAVVCRENEFGTGVSWFPEQAVHNTLRYDGYRGVYNTGSEHDNWISEVRCFGNETHIWECPYFISGTYDRYYCWNGYVRVQCFDDRVYDPCFNHTECTGEGMTCMPDENDEPMCACGEGSRSFDNNTQCLRCDDDKWKNQFKLKFGEECEEWCPCDHDNTESCDPFNGECQCKPGYWLDDCGQDINECWNSRFPHNCPEHSSCQNTIGSYECHCDSGYFKNENTGKCEELTEDDCANPNYMQLFPYGKPYGDASFTNILDDCTALKLDYKIPVGGYTRKRVFVCANGLVSLPKEYTSYIPETAHEIALKTFPKFNKKKNETVFIPYTILAPYHADNDLREGHFTCRDDHTQQYQTGGGNIFFRSIYDRDENDEIFTQTEELVRENEKSLPDYTASVIVIVTWDQVRPYRGWWWWWWGYYYGCSSWFQWWWTHYLQNEQATFQLVLTSDGSNTFAFFIYKQCGMNWRWYTRTLIGVVTKTSAKQHQQSFRWTVLQMDQYARSGNRRGILFYRLDYAKEANPKSKCRNWYRDNVKQLQYIKARAALMPVCPCNMNMLPLDFWYPPELQDPPNPQHSNNFRCSTVRTFWWAPIHGRHCCYDIRDGSFAPDKGGFLMYNPRVSETLYNTQDRKMRNICCRKSVNMCDKYYEVRPRGSCYNGIRVTFARFFGDPHIITLDKSSFTFNGLGEYILISLVKELNNEEYTFNLQGRTERYLTDNGTLSNATVWSAFAGADNYGNSFQVEMNPDKTELVVFANGSDKTNVFRNGTSALTIFSSTGMDLSRENGSVVASFTRPQIKIEISLAVRMLSVMVMFSAPDDYHGHVKGLLGYFDGSATNDYMFKNGTTLSPDSSDRNKFYYGQTWMINDDESVFTYTDGKDSSFYLYPKHVPVFLDEFSPEERQAAESICGNDTRCQYDLLETGSAKVAANTIGEEAATTELEELQAVTYPEVGTSDPDGGVLYITYGQLFRRDFYSLDGRSVEYTLTNDSAEISISKNEDGTSTLEWTPSSDEPIDIGIQVTDGDGRVSPVFQLYVVHCSGCHQHGTCNFEELYDEDDRETNEFKYSTCDCYGAWDGDFCEYDLDACTGGSCPGRACYDSNATYHNETGISFTCEPCQTGFLEDDDGKCVDIDECLSDDTDSDENGDCMHNCSNTEGSYECTCHDGYRVSPDDWKLCDDIDECSEGTHTCDYVCENVGGAYRCSCYAGFVFDTNDQSCKQDVSADPCEGSSLNCSLTAGCTNGTNGNPTCFCPSFYEMGIDTDGNTICTDIEECSLPTQFCSQVCTNEVGGFTCSCYDGYELDADRTGCSECQFPHFGPQCSQTCDCDHGTCDHARGCVCESGWDGTSCDENIDECDLDPNICADTTMECVDASPGYECSCISGYELDGTGSCIDIDECDETRDDYEGECGSNICTNSDGSYACECKPGFNVGSIDPFECIDIDECAVGQHECQHRCENSEDGSYSCKCYAGYVLETDRHGCVEDPNFDPCENSTITCEHFCTMNTTDKSVICLCDAGYELQPDKQNCTDIDECTVNNQCSEPSLCTNTPGGSTCSCPDGQKLQNDQVTCKDCDELHWGVNCATLCGCTPGRYEMCNKTTGCVCKPGWTGTHCETDIDECLTSPCTSPQTCSNYDGGYYCQCPTGYRASGSGCTEIDECLQGEDHCSQICSNTDGSYTCSCFNGFEMVDDECQDIDECDLDTDSCNQKCTNTQGGYRCSCEAGFKQTEANGPCSACDRGFWGMNCAELCQCNETYTVSLTTCDNINGSCQCNVGVEGKHCDEDLDECTTTAVCSGPHEACSNLFGSYLCYCDAGYMYEGGACEECDDGTWGRNCSNTCDCSWNYTTPGTTCNKTDGTCQCVDGIEGGNCTTDMDECLSSSPCTTGEKCVNTYGSFECDCLDGYVDVNGTCEDVDECETNTHNCNNLNNCSNTVGSFECPCKSSYMELVNGLCEAKPSKKASIVEMALTKNTGGTAKRAAVLETDIKTALSNYYSGELGSYYADVVILSWSDNAGTITVSYALIIEDSSSSTQATTLAIASLSSSTSTLTVGSVSTTVSAVSIDGNSVSTSGTTDTLLCNVYEALNGVCSGSECQVDSSGNAECVSTPSQSTDDDNALAIGIGVGITAFVLLVIGIVICVLVKKKKSVKEEALLNWTKTWPPRPPTRGISPAPSSEIKMFSGKQNSAFFGSQSTMSGHTVSNSVHGSDVFFASDPFVVDHESPVASRPPSETFRSGSSVSGHKEAWSTGSRTGPASIGQTPAEPVKKNPMRNLIF